MSWILHSLRRPALRRPFRFPLEIKRLNSTSHGIQRVSVPVGSSGDVNIDLHNINKFPSTEPMLIYLPPTPTVRPDDQVRLPKFLESWPTAVIRYRWLDVPDESGAVVDEDSLFDVLSMRRFKAGWPAPIHDTLKAYSWITDNLRPPEDMSRDIYLYGSYLGATLAASLALTECYPVMKMAVRGCIAHNGIYNWTMFLPDHKVNEDPKPRVLKEPYELRKLKEMIEVLFRKPDDFFDPFASPSLFFHTPGLLIPPGFNEHAIPPIPLSENAELPDHSRQAPLAYPPRDFYSEIPEMLLLYDGSPSLPEHLKQTDKNIFQNDFHMQAKMMSNAIKTRMRNFSDDDKETEKSNDPVAKSIQVKNVKPGALLKSSENVATAWLQWQILKKRESVVHRFSGKKRDHGPVFGEEFGKEFGKRQHHKPASDSWSGVEEDDKPEYLQDNYSIDDIMLEDYRQRRGGQY
ncbi:hypothetical protein GGR50DRAFT_660579 [Xylaria sp. CBS 124048]|nr:hypothetical protein GGR50DRAFT_660579 [Xylaria sp. CBS 124048]